MRVDIRYDLLDGSDPRESEISVQALPQVGHLIDFNGNEYEVVSVVWYYHDIVAGSEPRISKYRPTITLR